MARWPGLLRVSVPAAVMALGLAACAGGFASDESETLIVSEPAPARCALKGKDFSATVQTPIRIVLPKKAAPIELKCAAERHHVFVTTLTPRFNEKVFGNLLLGSVTGMIIDFTNGHSTKYPERVKVHMEPAAFATMEARDSWYGRYRTYIDWKWSRAEAEVIDICKADGEGYDCQQRRQTVAAGRAQEMEALERRRRQAHINASSTAETPAEVSLPQ